MSTPTPNFNLRAVNPATPMNKLGKELLDFAMDVDSALAHFDYNGADPNAVLAQVAALNSWIKDGSRAVASQAERDALFPAPAQGNTVYRKDRGWEERYYATYNAATNPGGATPAGWYPVAGVLPWATARKNGDQSVASGDIVLDIAPVDLIGGFTFASNSLVIPVTGTYEVSANIYIWSTTGTYRGAQAVAGSAMTVLISATTNSNWVVQSPKRRVLLTAGTNVRLRTSGDAAQTIRNEATPSLHVSYVGPPR